MTAAVPAIIAPVWRLCICVISSLIALVANCLPCCPLCLRSFSFLLVGARATEDARKGVVPLMARVLKDVIVPPRHRNRDGKGSRVHRWIRDRVLIVDQVL